MLRPEKLDPKKYRQYQQFERFLKEELQLSDYGAAAVIFYVRVRMLLS